MIDVQVGDDTAALADRQRLAPLLAGIGDPFLHAACQLAMGWTLPITGDLDGALREVTVALDELRGQDEPVFTAFAVFTAGSLNTALGRYDDALRDLREARDLAERTGGDWLGAGFRMQLAILAVLQGRRGEARELLDEALDQSLAARSTAFVTLCLAGYAQLAFAEGDPERAARLEGAAEGLRRRAGLRVWPALRHSEDELVAQVRQTLGGSPVRSGILCRFPAHPAASSRHRPGPAQHRRPDTLSRSVRWRGNCGLSQVRRRTGAGSALSLLATRPARRRGLPAPRSKRQLSG